MTIKLLTSLPAGKYTIPAGANVSLDPAAEGGLIAAKMAVATTAPADWDDSNGQLPETGSLSPMQAAMLNAQTSKVSDYSDPRRPQPARMTFIPFSSVREPIASPGDKGVIYAFPASAVNGTQVMLHEWQRDTEVLPATTTVVPRGLPFSAPSGAAISTGANVNVIVVTR